MYFKRLYQRPRPSQLRPRLMPLTEVPAHASFPGGHATEAHLIALVLGELLPDDHGAQALLEALVHRIAVNREVLGVHYRSDSHAGEILTGCILELAKSDAGGPPGSVLREARDAATEEWKPKPA